MSGSDLEAFLRDFYRNLRLLPLEPGDPRYVPSAERQELVDHLRRTIRWAGGESVQLFSGFRGTGKSTELRRLRDRLVKDGDLVVYVDLEEAVNLSVPLDVSDFLLTLAGTVGDALVRDGLLPEDPKGESYWARITRWLGTTVKLEGIALDGPGFSLKSSLKEDPSFKSELQEHLKGHLGALVSDVREFLSECVAALRARHRQVGEIVVLLDSLEHLRGTSANAPQVAASIENLFVAHADKLRFSGMHLVYTVPPWLSVVAQGGAGTFDAAELLPCVKVRDREGGRDEEGMRFLRKVLDKRGDVSWLLDEGSIDRLILASGGYLRDLFRMVQRVLILVAEAQRLPADPALVDRAIADLQASYLPIADEDAVRLARVAETRELRFADARQEIEVLSRFLDTHLVHCYRNGSCWYDVHPLVRDRVIELAAIVAREEDGADGTA